MGQGNKYGSIVETFIGGDLINILLSSKATPPADLNLAAADFSAAVDLYGSIAAGLRLGNFALGDVPRLVGIGIWCNIGDGLVQIDNPDSQSTGLTLQISGRSFNSANVQQQANIQVPSFSYKIQEFNNVEAIDNLLDMSVLDYSLTGQPTVGFGGYYRLTARIDAATADFAMISVDPAYAGKRLIMRPMVVIEHTYPTFITGF
jgi:hypothetical protein